MPNLRSVIILTGLVAFTFNGYCNETESETQFSNLTAFVHKKMAENTVPGVSMGVIHNGEIHTANFGVTNINFPQMVTNDTLFQIGSITKTMTGTIIMRLVEQGKIELDAPVQRYLPSFKVKDENVSKQVKVRDLLTHMSGWQGDYFSDTGDGDDALDKMLIEMADLEQLASINTVYSYNNSAFYVAAKVIEVVTGKLFQEVIQTMIFEDLNLENSYINPVNMMTKPFVVGHSVSDNSISVVNRWALFRAAWAAGGAITNVEDMLKYAAFHMGDGKNDKGEIVMKQTSLKAMQTMQAPKIGTDDAIGITWHLHKVGDLDIVSHGGATFGQLAYFMMVPSENFAFVIVTNANTGRALNRIVSNQALDIYFNAKNPPIKPQTVSSEQLAEYVGTYSRPTLTIVASIENGKLFLQPFNNDTFLANASEEEPKKYEYYFYDKDRAMEVGGAQRIEFIRLEDGSIGWLRAGRIHKKQ